MTHRRALLVYDADGVEQTAQSDELRRSRSSAHASTPTATSSSPAIDDPVNTLLDAITRKYDPDFTQIWEAVFDGAFDFDIPYGLHVDGAGNVYVVGFSDRVNQQANGFIEVYDADGNPLWGDEYNDELDIDESWAGVATDPMRRRRRGRLLAGARTPGRRVHPQVPPAVGQPSNSARAITSFWISVVPS